MSQVNWSSLEDDKMASQNSGVFNSFLNWVWNFAKWTYNFFDEGFWTLWDAIKDTWRRTYNFWKKIISWDIDWSKKEDLLSDVKEQQYSDFEIKQSEKLNQLWWMDLFTWLLWIWKEYLYNKPKEFLFWNEVINNLKVDKKEFLSQVWLYEKELEDLNSKLNNLDKTKYSNFLDFQEKVKAQYLKEKWLTSVVDESDFQLYMQQEFKRLNWIEQSNIIREQELYLKDTEDINNQILSKKEELKTYLNKSINPIWDKSGEQIYNEYNENKLKEFKNNEYIKTIREIYNYSKEQVEEWLEAKWLAKVSDWSWYDSMKEAIIDDIAAENQFYMSVLWMKDLPEYKKLANKAKEIRDVSYKFKINFMNNYMRNRNNEEFKWLDEVEIRNRIQKMTWDEMSLKDKEIYKQKEFIITEISALKNLQQAKKRIDPRALFDFVAFFTARTQWLINQAYDFDSKNVPHFVKQDMRNIIYSWEWIWKNIRTAITYNPDTIIDILIWSKWVNQLWKIGKWLWDIFKNLIWTDKLMKIKTKIWWWMWVVTFTSKTIKNLTASQLYGAVWDTVLDNVMVEAPTKWVEALNMYTNLLFDMSPFFIKEAHTWLMKSSTVNRIAYEFMHEDKKRAVNLFAKAHWIDIWTSRAILEDWVKKLYKTIFNPKEYEDILTRPWMLYDFVSNQINHMKKADVDAILSEKGIWVKLLKNFEWLDDEMKLNIKDAFDKSLLRDDKWNETIEAQMNKIRFYNILDLLKEQITPWKWWSIEYWWLPIRINKDAINDEKFQELYKKALKNIEDIKLSTNEYEFNKALDEYNFNLKEIRRNFSNMKLEQTIRLSNWFDNWYIDIRISDIEELSWKNIFDLVKEWKVEIIKENDQIKKWIYNIVTEAEQFLINFLEKNKKRIYDKEIELWLEWISHPNWNDIIWTIKKLIFSSNKEAQVVRFFWDLESKESLEKMHKTVEFINELLVEIFWKKYFWNKPIFINSSIEDINNETYKASLKQIKKLANNSSWFLNLTYWYFKSSPNTDNIFAMYIYPWKELFKDDIIKQLFEFWEKEFNPAVFNNQSKKLIKKIFSNWVEKDKFNFEKWFVRARSIFSAYDVDWIFVDWVVDKEKVFSIIDSILWTKWDIHIKNFIYEAVKDLTENESAIIKPIIYNFTYNYANNKSLIDEIFKKKLLNKTKDFAAIFADILLSPTIRKQIAENITKSWKLKEYNKLSESIEKKLEAQINKFVLWLENKKKILQLDIEKLENYKKWIYDLSIINRLNDKIFELKNRIESINQTLRNKSKIYNKEKDNFVIDYTLNFLKQKSLQVSNKMFWTSFRFLEEFWWDIKKTAHEVVNDVEKKFKNIFDFSKEELEIFKKWLYDIVNNDLPIEERYNKINLMEESRVKNVLKSMFNDVSDIWDSSKIELRKDLFNDEIKDAITKWVLPYDYAMENNPIEKALNAFINNNPTWRIPYIEELFIKHFSWDDKNEIKDIASNKNKIIKKSNKKNEVYIFEWKYNADLREKIKNDKDSLYVFWDNFKDAEIWYVSLKNSTQRVIRWLDNAVWICTKKNRGTNNNSYLSDDDFEDFKKHLDEKIKFLKDSWKRIVFPKWWIWTWKADLKNKAPAIFQYLNKQLLTNFWFSNEKWRFFHIEDLIEITSSFELNKNKTLYIDTKTWEKYKRVTDEIWKNIKEKDVKFPDLIESWKNIWNNLDKSIKDFFKTWKLENTFTDSEEDFKIIKDKLNNFKEKHSNEKFYSNVIVFDDKKGIAWEIDLLSVDKDWNIKIYEIFSKRDNTWNLNIDKTFIANSKNLEQVEKYLDMLQSLTWKEVEMYLMPFKVNYAEWKVVDKASSIKLENIKKINIQKLNEDKTINKVENEIVNNDTFQELLEKPKFQEFIKEISNFKSKNILESANENRKKFEEKIKEIFSWYEIIWMKDDWTKENITNKLIDKLLNDWKLYRLFLNYWNRKIYNKNNWLAIWYSKEWKIVDEMKLETSMLLNDFIKNTKEKVIVEDDKAIANNKKEIENLKWKIQELNYSLAFIWKYDIKITNYPKTKIKIEVKQLDDKNNVYLEKKDWNKIKIDKKEFWLYKENEIYYVIPLDWEKKWTAVFAGKWNIKKLKEEIKMQINKLNTEQLELIWLWHIEPKKEYKEKKNEILKIMWKIEALKNIEIEKKEKEIYRVQLLWWINIKTINKLLGKYRSNELNKTWISYIKNKLKNDKEKEKLNLSKYTNIWPDYNFKLFSDILNKKEGIYILDEVFKKSKDFKEIYYSLKPKLDEWYAFVWWFWDKDSWFHLYKAPKNIMDLLEEWENKQFLSEIYNIAEYAYSRWYLKDDRNLKTYKEFEEKLILNLKEKLKKDKFTVEEIYNELWNLANENILPLDEIRKREAFNTSTYSTFRNVDKKLELYVLEEDIPKTDIDIETNWEIDKEKVSKLIDDAIKWNKSGWIYDNIKYLYEQWWKVKNDDFIDVVISLITSTIKNDKEDGTSYASNNILRQRFAIWWIDLSKWENEWIFKQFKDHLFWKIDWTTFWVKTLFNWATIKESPNWKELDNVVIAWKSSVKLWKDLIDYDNKKTLFINWVPRIVYWLKWNKKISTQFFKNASTDFYGHEKVTFSTASILPSLSTWANDKIFEIQKRRLQEKANEILSLIWDKTITLNSMSRVDSFVNKIKNEINAWFLSSPVISSKLKLLFEEFKNIINKPKEPWQSVFIFKSEDSIEPHEIIMHEKSKLVKLIQDEVAFKKYWVKFEELKDKKQIDYVNDHLFTVWYRYPVPSRYNIWVFKIVLNTDKRLFKEYEDEKFWTVIANEYEDMWYEEAVPNPDATYLKFEWDNDWDHLFFISAYWDFWRIVAADVLRNWKKFRDNIDDPSFNLVEEYKKHFDKWDLVNEFIVLKQTEKGKKRKFDLFNKDTYQSLLKSRLTALTAKEYVWVVQATNRTIKNFIFMVDKFSEEELKKIYIPSLWEELTEKWELKEKIEFVPAIKLLDFIDENKVENLKRKYAEKSSQLAQDTLDFGNSWKDVFEFDYPELLKNVLKDWVDYDLFYAKFIQPSSKSYNVTFKYHELPETKQMFDSNWKYNEEYQKNILKLWWNKRRLHKFIAEMEVWEEWNKVKLSDLIDNLNKGYEPWFIYNKVSTAVKNIEKLKNKELSILGDKVKKFLLDKRNLNKDKALKDYTKFFSFKKHIEKNWLNELKWLYYDLDKIIDFKYDNFYKWEKNENYFYWIDDGKQKYYMTQAQYFNSIIMKHASKDAKKLYKEALEKYIQEKNKYIKYEQIKTLYAIRDSKEIDENEKSILAFWLYLNKELQLYNLINEDEFETFLKQNDKYILNKKVWDEERWFKRIKDILNIKENDKEEIIKTKAETKIELNNKRIKEIEASLKEQENSWIEEALIAEKKSLEEQNKQIQDYINNLESIRQKEEEIIEQYKKEEIILPWQIPEYEFPWINEQWVFIDKDWIQKLITENEWFINKSINRLSWRIITFFENYIPKLLIDYNNLNDLLWVKLKAWPDSLYNKIFKATTEHLYQFNEYFWKKDSIIIQLKDTWIEKYDDLARKIQYELLDNINWKYELKPIDKIKDSVFKHLKDTRWEYLIKEQKFIDSLIKYQNEVVSPVVDIANQLQVMWYNISEAYKWNTKYSLIIDILEAHKADPQLALKLNWFHTKEQFEMFIEQQIDREWKRPKKWTIKTMIDVLYHNDKKWYEKLIWKLKWLHYKMTYWELSLITGNGIITWLAQIFPNYVELRSYLRKNLTDIKQWYEAIQRFWFLDSESVLDFASWIWKDFNNSDFLDWLITKALNNFWIRNIKWNRAAAMIHAIVTNPLWVADYPLELMRKMVATSNAMKTLWIKDVDELEKNIRLYWKEYEWLVRSEIRKQYAESGWWVISSSQLYRDTIFNHLHNYVDIFSLRFFTTTMSYLMWWSYHKTATLMEKESTLYYWIKDLIKWNFKWAKAHIDDFFTYNTMIAYQLAAALWIYMKMEKYEKNTNDWVSFDNFAWSFMNSVVSFKILLERHLKNWETAWEAWWTLQDQITYTTIWMIRQMFRLFWQVWFIWTVYKHYLYSQEQWNVNLFDSLMFAMKQHYAWYQKFNWYFQLDEMYNIASNEWKIAMLWTWAETEMEELFKKLESWKYFSYYKDKWFIKTLYDMFIGWWILGKWFTYMPAWLQSKISSDLVKLVMEDEELSKLIRWWQFGKWEWNYDISRLFWKEWTDMDEEQMKRVNELYNHIYDYLYYRLKSDWIKEDSKTQSKYDRMLHQQIDKALEKEWINIKDLISSSDLTPTLLKTMAVLESKYWLKWPLVLSLIIDTEYKQREKELREEKWRYTWEISKYWTPYKTLLEEDKIKLKRDLLIKYQEFFNLNRDIWMEIIAQDIRMNHKDKLESIRKLLDKYWNIEKDMIDYLQKSYLIWQVAKEWGTSVSKLHSRYALAAKWLQANETTVVIANNFLRDLFNKDWLSYKEKLANAARFISWLDKATYWMLSNNEEFNKLTDDSKKLLMNWIFKINKEAMQYDSKDLLNDLNQSSSRLYNSPYIKPIYPKYKSNSFGWMRPWFSKQFKPIQWIIKKHPQYITPDYNWYIRKYNTPNKRYKVYNNLKAPIMRKYKDLLLEQLFYWYKSKWIIKQQIKKFDNKYKKDIKLKKPKKIKEKKYLLINNY